MKRTIQKWTIRLTTTGVVLVGLLIGIVLNPKLLYANQTVVGNYTIYHSSEIDNNLLSQLESVTFLLEKSQLFDSAFRLDICLNDGSYYPLLIEKIKGQAFALGFYNKVVLQGNANYRENHVELNGYNWNLVQLISHEAIHCCQYNKFGFWNSNPMANYPNWKWEGYPEYVSRQNPDQKDFFQNLDYFLIYQEKNKDSWAIEFDDGTISPIDYYRDWLLVKYSLDVKQLTYEELLRDSKEKEEVEKDMLSWFKEKRK